jgi:hypothetical protein
MKKMDMIKKGVAITGTLAMMMVVGFAMPGQNGTAQAAKAQKNIVVKPGVTTKIQLDGKGKTESIYWNYSVVKVPTSKPSQYDLPGMEVYDYTTTTTIKINGKVVDTIVHKAIRGWEEESKNVELVVTDVNTKDKLKDIFFGQNSGLWAGEYKELRHYQYSKGKVKKDNFLNVLKSVKTPKSYDGSTKKANLLESCKGLSKDMNTTGNGTLNWHVCLQESYIGYAHGFVPLQLKSYKIKLKSSSPSGTIYEVGCVDYKTKKMKVTAATTFYKKAASKSVSFKAKVGDQGTLKSFQYINNKLYLKFVTTKGKSGWLPAAKITTNTFYLGGTLHA